MAAALAGVMVGYSLSTSTRFRDVSSPQLQLAAARHRASLINPTDAGGLELKLDRGMAQPINGQYLRDRPAVLM